MIWSHWSKEIKFHRTISLPAFLSPQRTNVTQCSHHLLQRAEILTQRSNFNASTGILQMIWLAFDIKQVDFTPSSLFSRKLQTAVSSLLRMEVFLPKTLKNCRWMHWAKNDLHEEGLDRYLGTWLHLRIGKNYSHNRAAKHQATKQNLLFSPRVSSKITRSWPWWMLPPSI